MKRIILMVALGAAVFAQEQARPKWHQRYFELEHIDVDRLGALIGGIPGVSVRSDGRLRILSVGAEDPDKLKEVEELIKRFDRPKPAGVPGGSRNVELTAHLLIAGNDLKVGDAVPPDLEPVARQLRSIFGYKDIQLLDTAFLRNREELGGDVGGTIMLDAQVPQPSRYSVKYGDSYVRISEKGNTVRLNRFAFSMSIPVPISSFQPGTGGPTVSTQFQYMDVGFNTSIDIREGQKVVVGKSNIGREKKSLIVVLTAKVVD